MTGDKDSEKDSVLTLRDESFPRVYTWDHFLQVLENTARIWHRQDFPELVGQIVDFHRFKVEYWPRFSHAITKEFSVNLVFAEIMGVIKGSASSAESLAPLQRNEYLTRSYRMAPTFATELERSRVYDLFELYEALKTSRGDMDSVDRVVRLLRAMRQDPSLTKQLGSKIDEVYIDEIQDQRCLDIKLLLSFVKDPRGFHFAGDTAQAISQDSTIRFSDIKEMFFQHFAAVSISTGQADLARPELFTLTKNYRSHQGILSLASFVMGMIWQGFPETVDKLEPEIGNFSGPRPLMFIGVDFNLLRSSNAGHATFSVGTADFGAEQAILVRDTNTQIALQDHLGDVALVFTILDSKGMEFDDVILWNFFTDCLDQAGLRSLEVLKNEPAKFDPRKHGGMCLELKNLYVAVTRARNQLFVVESSETTAASVLKLLAHDPQALIDVTRPKQGDFKMKIDLMRPSSSMDPVGWRRRGDECMHQGFYRQARSCFRNANCVHGETVAEGYVLEEDGDTCKGKMDFEGFTHNLEGAVEHFLKAELIKEAARILAKLDKLEDAADLWSKHDNHAKAARLYTKAGLYMKAFRSFDNAREYSEAVAMLQKEKKYDQLVSYLDENRESIPANTMRGYSLLCKLLLKQNRVSAGCRKHAINVLGSSAEQEACFMEYEMDEELMDLYTGQLRHKDLFHLLNRKGQLEQALSLAITKDLLQSTADALEFEVLSLLDYVWVGHLQKNRQQRSVAPLKLPPGFLTPSVILRAKQWQASNLVHSLEGSIARQHVGSMKNSLPKTILCLRKILDATAITKSTTLNDLPFEMMEEAVNFAKDLTLGKGGDTLKTMFLLAGLWKPISSKGNFIVLQRSPIREALTNVSSKDPTKTVTKQVLDHLVSAILAFDAKARDLWRKKWPKRCVHFATIEFCPRKRHGEECDGLHQLVSADDCSRKLDDLLLINSIFCDLAVLYYRRCVNEKFLGTYMGIKRYWLERLLRELTYLSSAEQHTSAIVGAQAELFRDKRLIAISSFLEELLYFRLGKEWNQRSDFTSLLEQMQLAKALGSTVQTRLFRALSHRLFNDRRHLMQRHLVLLNSLKQDLSSHDASAFQSTLNGFLRNLPGIDVQAFSTLHALTAVFEYLTAYLILKTCVAECVLTQAWIDQHVPRFAHAIHSAEPLEWFQWNHKYQQCLMELTKAFCAILRRLNEVPQPGINLLCSGKSHHAMLLRQRNAELVAIVVANLAPTRPTGLGDLWTIANEVFALDFIRAYHLRSPIALEVAPKLASSLLKYNSKDSLVVVIRDRKKDSPFSALENQPSVKTVAFDKICPPVTTPATTQASADIPPSTASNSLHEEYTTAETEAASKIQHVWRSCSRKIKIRHSYVELPEARAITQLHLGR